MRVYRYLEAERREHHSGTALGIAANGNPARGPQLDDAVSGVGQQRLAIDHGEQLVGCAESQRLASREQYGCNLSRFDHVRLYLVDTVHWHSQRRTTMIATSPAD